MTLVSDNVSALPSAIDQASAHVDPQSKLAERVPDESRAARARSFDVGDFVVPTGREEEWRFTPVDRLVALFSDTATDDRDGDLAATFEVSVPDTIAVGTLAWHEAPRGTVLVPEDRSAVLASANTADALHVVIPADAEMSEPLRVNVHGNGAQRRSNSHVVLEAGRHSKALVIIDHTGSADHAGNVEIIVGDGAELTVVSLQRWADDANHLAQHEALVGRDATYKHIAVSLGGAIVRMNSNVRYAGSGGDATLFGRVFRRRRSAPGAPLVHRPQHASRQVLGDLQGRPAG